MPPPGKYHGFVCGNLSRILGNYAADRSQGYVCTNDSGVIVESDPDTVRGPDVTFYEDACTAETMEREYASEPPRLAVDVLSPNDRVNRLNLRISQLLRAGVAAVWVVDPEARDVAVYRPGQDPVLLTESDALSGSDILPGFSCSVAELFAVPGGPAAKSR